MRQLASPTKFAKEDSLRYAGHIPNTIGRFKQPCRVLRATAPCQVALLWEAVIRSRACSLFYILAFGPLCLPAASHSVKGFKPGSLQSKGDLLLTLVLSEILSSERNQRPVPHCKGERSSPAGHTLQTESTVGFLARNMCPQHLQ